MSDDDPPKRFCSWGNHQVEPKRLLKFFKSSENEKYCSFVRNWWPNLPSDEEKTQLCQKCQTLVKATYKKVGLQTYFSLYISSTSFQLSGLSD